MNAKNGHKKGRSFVPNLSTIQYPKRLYLRSYGQGYSLIIGRTRLRVLWVYQRLCHKHTTQTNTKQYKKKRA